MRKTAPNLGFAVRHPILMTLVVMVLVTTFTISIVGASFDVAHIAIFPLVVVLSLGIPSALTPAVVFPLLVTIRRQHELRAELERLAHVDALTDLPNRRAFFEFAVVVAKRQAIVGTPMAAMMIDVDRFKAINDSYGHDQGDMVLKRIADTILAEVTAVKAPRWIVARLGGEEFVALVDGLAPSAIGRLAERICNQVHRSVGAGDRLDPVTVSVGVALRKHGIGIDRLLKAADDAVYSAKRAGRDRWAFATEDLPAAAKRSAPAATATLQEAS